MSPTLRNILIGCGAVSVIGVVVVVGACALFVGTSGGGGSADTEEPTPEELREQAAAIGEPVNAGEMEWTVLAAKQAEELTYEFETATGNFVIVDVRFVNGSGEAVTLDSSSLVLIDSENRRNEVDTDRFQFVPEGRDLFLEQVNPGVSKDGQAIFTVAPGASGFVLEAGDTDPFGGENAYVDLGF